MRERQGPITATWREEASMKLPLDPRSQIPNTFIDAVQTCVFSTRFFEQKFYGFTNAQSADTTQAPCPCPLPETLPSQCLPSCQVNAQIFAWILPSFLLVCSFDVCGPKILQTWSRLEISNRNADNPIIQCWLHRCLHVCDPSVLSALLTPTYTYYILFWSSFDPFFWPFA